jgi:hypothetical protein
VHVAAARPQVATLDSGALRFPPVDGNPDHAGRRWLEVANGGSPEPVSNDHPIVRRRRGSGVRMADRNKLGVAPFNTGCGETRNTLDPFRKMIAHLNGQ